MAQPSIAVAVIAAATLVVSALLHKRAGIIFPVPWHDEASFLWPARAFYSAATLRAPQLNPDRALFWMPPGYSILIGGLLGFTGPSLIAARWFSWTATALSYLGLLAFLWRYGARLTAAALLSIALLTYPLIAAGNIARMDALLMLIAVAGYIWIQRGEALLGLACICLGLVLHPNAIYFLTAAVAYVVVWDRDHLRLPRRPLEIAFCIIVLVLLVAYSIYVARNHSLFLADMRYQMERKASRGLAHLVLSWPGVLAPIGLLFVLILAGLTRRELMLPALFFAGSVATYIIGREMWYISLAVAGMAVGGHVAIVALGLWVERRFGKSIPDVLIAMLILVTTFGVDLPRLPMYRFRSGTTWYGMKISRNPLYLTEEDRSALRTALDRVSPDATARVEFYPPGDSLLLADAVGRPAFEPHFTRATADVLVIHVSEHMPDLWKARMESELRRLGPGQPVSTREDTEKWYIGTIDKSAPIHP